MPTVSTETMRTGGVTLVEVRVTAEAPHRIRLESRLDGPIWPPRSGGTVAAGWDQRGLTRVVPAGVTGIGFATPATPAAPAVELTTANPTEERPEEITTWLERIEERVATAETLAEAGDVHSATAAIESIGSLAAVEELAAALERDRRVLGRLSFVPDELRRQVESVDVPTATLARIAGE